MNFTLAELTRIKLEPDEVLSVKFYGDDYDETNLKSLQEHLKTVFPNNKVIVFNLPNGTDLQMEAIKATLEVSEDKELAKDCSIPTSYCNDCACGKKEMIENEKIQD